jgi:hypothetical protein
MVVGGGNAGSYVPPVCIRKSLASRAKATANDIGKSAAAARAGTITIIGADTKIRSVTP